MRIASCLPAVALALGLAAARPASAEFAYAIGDGGFSLLRFSTSSPGSAVRVASFGGAGTSLDAIDFRPATGQLYGYNDRDASYYTVDLATGTLTSATASSVGVTTNTNQLGIDFNPVIDRLRVVTDSTQNLVYSPNTLTATAATSLFYGPGDASAGLAPVVIDNAYTNNFAGALTTQQYVLDYDQDSLSTLANNAGTLATVGKITLGGNVLDFDVFTGFDISTSLAGVNTAFAVLTVGGDAGLYSIDLTNGDATSLGSFGTQYGPVYSLAVVPSSVPEPSSMAMMAIAFGGAGFMAIRRRSLV